jgi:hypothetical protein
MDSSRRLVSFGKFDKGVTTTYSLKKKAMVSMLLSFPEIDGQELETRDGNLGCQCSSN